MDTHQNVARSLFELAYDTKPHPRYPQTVHSGHPSWVFDLTVIVLLTVGVTLYFAT